MVLIFWSFKHNYIRIRYIHCLALNCLILIHMCTYMDMLLIVWSRMYTCRHTHCHVFGRPISCIYLYVYTMLLPCVYIYLYITVTALSCPCISMLWFLPSFFHISLMCPFRSHAYRWTLLLDVIPYVYILKYIYVPVAQCFAIFSFPFLHMYYELTDLLLLLPYEFTDCH